MPEAAPPMAAASDAGRDPARDAQRAREPTQPLHEEDAARASGVDAPERANVSPGRADGHGGRLEMVARSQRFAFPFAEGESHAVRARIGADLDRIARAVCAADPALVALVLTGGFSRGEGTVRDGRPVNDYDFVAIRALPGGDALYRRLAHGLTERTGIEVDILPVWRVRLPRVGRKLFWLDVASGAKVIAGDVDILREMPALTAADLPRHEAARLLGNRAAGLLLALPGPGVPIDRRQVDLQSAKAILAAMDATLLHRGRYAARLRDRLDLSQGHPHHATFAAAVAWKLDGSEESARVTWEEAAAVLLDAVAATGARRVRDGLAEHAVHALRARRLRASPSQRLRLAAWDLLEASRFPEGPDPEAARAILARLGNVDGDATGWEDLKKAFFALRAMTLQ